eukprot:4582441-Prymnesium_polylepis.2
MKIGRKSVRYTPNTLTTVSSQAARAAAAAFASSESKRVSEAKRATAAFLCRKKYMMVAATATENPAPNSIVARCGPRA